MVGIGGVATATVVQQVGLVVGVKHVVDLVVDASEGQHIWVVVPTCKYVSLLSSGTLSCASIHKNDRRFF